MLNFYDKILDETRWDQQPKLFPERKEDMYELLHVTAEKWNNNIGINLSSFFLVDNHDDAINNLDIYFANALNLKGEASNFAVSIWSCNVSKYPCGLFDEPILTTLDELEEALGLVLNKPAQIESVKAFIASIESNSLKGVSSY